MSELKGVSVKIAQQVALGMPFLSSTYISTMSKSFNAIPPLNRVLVKKIIKQELGNYPQKLFDTFNEEAFAAASLGQVHLATYQGKQVAVKLQYPGIKNSIKNDMGLIHFGLKRFAKGHNIDHLITEIEERLYEEVEYTLEAENYSFFASHMHMDHIIIPKVYFELSTNKVLTTSMLSGISLESFLANKPSQKKINAYAQLIFDSFFYTLYHLGRIHADPNPGNFIFMNEGKLGMIDFGCVKTVDKDFLKKYTALHVSLLERASDKEIIPHYVDFGMIREDSDEKMLHFYQEIIKPLDRLYIEPLMNKNYDFKIHSDFAKRGFEAIFEVHAKQYHSVHQVNQEYIFLDRTLLGYYAIFEKMGAEIDTSYMKTLINQFQKEQL